MQTRVHLAEDVQVVVSHGSLLMRIVGPMQSRLRDIEFLYDRGLELVEEFGELGVTVVLNHGARPPPPSEMPKIVALAKRLSSHGPSVSVLMGLRPLPLRRVSCDRHERARARLRAADGDLARGRGAALGLGSAPRRVRGRDAAV